MKQPVDVFLDWLSNQPADARVAVAIDSDRLVGETGLLGKPVIADAKGRSWQIVVFRGDDLDFRLTFRKASKQPRTVLVLTRGLAGKPIEVSCVTDILARNEAGTPLDLSVPAFFRRICPKINFPVDELRHYKEPLLSRLDNVPNAVAKLVERWGRPADWGRGQIAALVLLAQHPGLNLGDFWPDETEPVAFLAHAVRILLSAAQLGAEPAILRDVIQYAARQQMQEYFFWLDVPGEELAAYLVLRLAADQLKLQNPANQLAGLHLFAVDTPLTKMEGLGLSVARTIAADEKLWSKVHAKADSFVTPARLEQVAQLLPSAGGTTAVQADLPPMLLFYQLRHAMMGFFAAPASAGLAWAKPLTDHPLLAEAAESLSGRVAQCRAALRFAVIVSSIEERLQVITVPKFSHADGLLDWYIQQGQHGMELDLSRACHDIESCEDAALAEAANAYLFGGPDDQAPTPQSLKGRIRSRLDELNCTTANFVRTSPAAFAVGANSALGILKSQIKPIADKVILGTSEGRVWILIFDGMRFDTWDTVVRPIIAEHFTFKGKPWFCVLPSYTAIARTSLLAGCLPEEWKNHKGAFTKDEATLVARALGLTAQEAKSKLRFITEADTTKARMSMGFADSNAREVNVLIYPISDECHEFRGDLASFNQKIRVELLGDKSQGIRGILDDLLRRIRPEDTVLLTSDHGFIEMLSPDAILVPDAEAQAAARVPQEDIRYRYTKGFRPSQAPDAVELLAGSEQHFMAVGGRWFRREGGKMPRYCHGGLSLAEIVIPGYVLSRVSEKQARVELNDLNDAGISVPEDQSIDFAFTVRNSGNIEVKYDLSVRSNLGEDLLAHQATLAPAGIWKATCRLIGKYRQTAAGDVDPAGTLSGITIRLRHTDLQGRWRDALDGLVTVPVSVQAKTFKLETDALKGFDEI